MRSYFNKRVKSSNNRIITLIFLLKIKLEEFVQRAKELTEEREKLSRDFKDENDELKRKIDELENEVEFLNEELDRKSAAKSARLRSDASSDG